MKYCILCLLMVVVGSSGCSDSSAPQPPASPDPLQGSWQLVWFDGWDMDGSITWHFDRGNLMVNSGTAVIQGTYIYDTIPTPHHLDLSFAGLMPDPNPSIFEFRADTLVVKGVDQGGELARAEEFSYADGYDLEKFVPLKSAEGGLQLLAQHHLTSEPR